MTEMTDDRSLNRATLARQFLLERSAFAPLAASLMATFRFGDGEHEVQLQDV